MEKVIKKYLVKGEVKMELLTENIVYIYDKELSENFKSINKAIEFLNNKYGKDNVVELHCC